MRDTKVMILDFDGTLCRTDEVIVHCLGSVLRDAGYFAGESTDILAGTISRGFGLEQTMRLSGVRDADLKGLMAKYRAAYAAEGDPLCELFPYVAETLARLRSRGLLIVVLSNKGEAAIERALHRFGVREYICLVVGETTGISPKPSPDSFESIIAPFFGFSSGRQCVVVGDTEVDIAYASAIDAISCWVTYGYGDAARCRALQPNFSIDCISALAHLY